MIPTPTGGSAPRDGADGGAQVAPATATGSDADGGDPRAAAPPVPAPRSGPPGLPRRGGSTVGPPLARRAEPRKARERDPDGRLYGTADEETLNRLLTGLRDI